jgi:Na+-driven multidrug efflux pump
MLLAPTRRVGSLGLPLALQFVAGYGLTIIGAVFIGRLGPEPLSISVLASSFYNVAGLSVALGLSSGMETLCGQVGLRRLRDAVVNACC